MNSFLHRKKQKWHRQQVFQSLFAQVDPAQVAFLNSILGGRTSNDSIRSPRFVCSFPTVSRFIHAFLLRTWVRGRKNVSRNVKKNKYHHQEVNSTRRKIPMFVHCPIFATPNSSATHPEQMVAVLALTPGP